MYDRQRGAAEKEGHVFYQEQVKDKCGAGLICEGTLFKPQGWHCCCGSKTRHKVSISMFFSSLHKQHCFPFKAGWLNVD
jgi:hypothetical protein